MIEESQADKFMDRIYSLISSNLRTTKDKDVVLLMGGTGNGKSTILNMIAGSKITALINQVDGSWQFSANPSIAMIGHTISMTFVPNYWEGNGLRIYDCPGFNDTRDIEHQIVKSFFIKEIAENAKSIKVIFVSEHSNIYSRCVQFLDCIKQLKQFIPNFDVCQDYSLIVTKSEARFKPNHISSKILSCTKINLHPDRITNICNPIQQGLFDTSSINFEEAIKRTPTISGKCNLPISSEAKLKLIQISKELNNSIERAVRVYSKNAKLYYIQVLSINLEASNTEIQNIYKLFKKTQSEIKSSQTGQEFLKNIKKLSQSLSNDCKLNFNYLQICNFIEKKLKHIYFIKEKIDYFQINLNYWIQAVNFQCESFFKSNNNTNLKNFDIFASFLEDSYKIDINLNLKDQAHAYLLKEKNITVPYNGSTKITGNLTTSGICKKRFKIPYIAQATFDINEPYSGQVQYKGQKTVFGTVSVQRCCCGYNNLLGGRSKCHLCNHSYFDLPYNKSISYDGYAPYSGRVKKRITQKCPQIVNFQKQKAVNVSVKYNQNVNYSGNHTGCCEDHHQCSCSQLASLAFAAKEIYQDLLFYYQIQELQLIQMQQNGEGPNHQVQIILKKLNFEGYSLTNPELKEKDIADRIHDKLTNPNSFTSHCSGNVDFKIQKMYNQGVRFQGSIPVAKTIQKKDYIDYDGIENYSKTISYSGSVSAKTCYENCSFCNSSNYNESYSGSVAVSGQVHYKGTIYYSGKQQFSSNIQYDQQIPFVGSISQVQNVAYKKEIEIICPEDKSVGNGHHSCTSCQTWQKFINAIKKLLELKKEITKKIKDNKVRLQTMSG